MTTEPSELPGYPPALHDDLSMDDVYRELQLKAPFKARLPFGEPIWIATRYEDVKMVYGDRRFGKVVGYGRDTPRMHGISHGSDPSRLDNMDPPNHTRVRRLASGAFAPPRIRAMAGWIEGLAAGLLDDIAAQGDGADFMALFAWKLPLQVISGIVGAPEDSLPAFKAWIDQMTGVDSTLEQRMEAYESMRARVRGLIAERRETTTDDLLCTLVQARDEGDRLSEDELVSLSMTLLLGGFETTATQLGSTVWTLMAHRHLWQELLDDPDLLPNALEELWRWIPSFRHGQAMIRWASEDVELSDGVVVPAGDPVLPEHHVANRDESVFPHGWELDVHRTEPEPHLSLAWGPHRCMGARLATLEVETTVRALLERFPTLDLAVPPDEVEWSRLTFLRSAAALPLTW
ncbi:MAG TPA: cytochrome P450 [Acidimicrobiales bacterium]|nr:cytochrome P450 [Acidimicrobiales bacterium]